MAAFLFREMNVLLINIVHHLGFEPLPAGQNKHTLHSYLSSSKQETSASVCKHFSHQGFPSGFILVLCRCLSRFRLASSCFRFFDDDNSRSCDFLNKYDPPFIRFWFQKLLTIQNVWSVLLLRFKTGAFPVVAH